MDSATEVLQLCNVSLSWAVSVPVREGTLLFSLKHPSQLPIELRKLPAL